MADQPGGEASATQETPHQRRQREKQEREQQEQRQESTDTALAEERGGNGDDRYGGDEPLPYPEHEPLDTITYRDPRPLDWPQKADRSVFIGNVHIADPDPDADDPSGDYLYPNQFEKNDDGVAEVDISPTTVEHAQVVSGSGRLMLTLNGEQFDLTALGGSVQADLGQALLVNANS